MSCEGLPLYVSSHSLSVIAAFTLVLWLASLLYEKQQFAKIVQYKEQECIQLDSPYRCFFHYYHRNDT